MSTVYVAPSILSADFSRIEAEVAKMEVAGARFIHLDVMDGRFVEATTFGPELVERIASSAGKMIKDTHLMVEDPMSMIKRFAQAGSDLITVHYESFAEDKDRFECIRYIHSLGLMAGMSVKPNTPADVLLRFLPELDLVLIMSVEPGKGGQAFMNESLEKISFIRKNIGLLGRKTYLEVDGGINAYTGKLVVEAGADVLVAGSYLYGHEDYAERVEALLHL